MLFYNKEFRRAMLLLSAFGTVLTVIGFIHSPVCGSLVLVFCAAVCLAFGFTEHYRYTKLQKLNKDLDALLTGGIPLPIREYNEGELSILANHIQKITQRLVESAEATKADRIRLANSLADISHQLRTPLTAINLTATMLQEKNLPNKRRIELARELQGLLTRTDWLVESLLKLSKLDAGTVKLGKNTISVNELIHQASEPLLIPMELRGQRLVAHCDLEAFQGDLVWSAEALGNILKNCMEHTPNGGTIIISAVENALYTQITVEDTGSGFVPQDIPHLFERFYKGGNASETGYGIGLALARTIITAQNGTVQAMNGKSGAKFVIKFYKQVI